jgi:hypothetical protein
MAPKSAPKGETVATIACTVVEAMLHDGESYLPGDTVMLTLDQASQLGSLGVIVGEAVVAADPAPAT